MPKRNLDEAKATTINNKEIEKEIKRLADLYSLKEITTIEVPASYHEGEWSEIEENWDTSPTLQDLIIQIKSL